MKRKASPSPQGDNQEPARKKHEGEHEVAERLEAAQTLVNLKNSGTQKSHLEVEREAAERLEAAQTLAMLKNSGNSSTQNDHQETAFQKLLNEHGDETTELLEAAEVLMSLNKPTSSTTVASRPRNIFRWNDLPGELKNRIYAYALEDDQDIVIRQQGHPRRAHLSYIPTDYSPWRAIDRHLGPRNPNLSLLRVSKQIYREARLFLHRGNTLRFVTVRDFHCWVHHKQPAAVYVRNAALWYNFHGKTLVWEMAIPPNHAGLILTPVRTEERARTLRETPSVVMHDFLDSLSRRYLPPRLVLVFGNAPLAPAGGGAGGGNYSIALRYHAPVWYGGTPLVPGCGSNQPRTDWHTYPTNNRKLVHAHGKVVRLGVDLWGFLVRWEGMPSSHLSVKLPVHNP
ncbi:hypothetical protein SLS58_007419 [Diplodia intermedia]|uniref:Uncharacterized protein n=1 Tax=Diplodia intermedia TaxID=856260 RepID=A0ABR3TKT7_9PEZI